VTDLPYISDSLTVLLSSGVSTNHSINMADGTRHLVVIHSRISLFGGEVQEQQVIYFSLHHAITRSMHPGNL